eukprot:TRINITY_DN113531_c0_g1_i1.p1 TRINITY_DN113531_c0_g1~~TRINITY_DN113531_c0_g1_i1.p1  ORF type:complete len:172 (+),score=27.03 TRINITY_DN113531_c0_g1_i1:52-516(+)
MDDDLAQFVVSDDPDICGHWQVDGGTSRFVIRTCQGHMCFTQEMKEGKVVEGNLHKPRDVGREAWTWEVHLNNRGRLRLRLIEAGVMLTSYCRSASSHWNEPTRAMKILHPKISVVDRNAEVKEMIATGKAYGKISKFDSFSKPTRPEQLQSSW